MVVSVDPIGPQDAAFAWLAELNGGDTPPDRLAAFRAWEKADPAHGAAFARAQALWRDLDWSEALNAEVLETGASPRPTASPARRDAATRRSPQIRRWMAAGLSAAACLVLAVVGVPGFHWLLDALPTRTVETVTGPGDIRRIDLADGSHVTLGGRSSLRIRMTRDRRLLELVDGDAYFEVAPDRERPFVVKAGDLTATALGTAFEVNRGSRRIQVSVTHGRVRAVAAKGDDATLTPGQRARLVAGQNDLAVEPFDPATAGRWRSKRAAFRNAPLQQVVEDLNRYHPAGVVLADPTLGDQPVSAAFRLDQMEVALDGVALSLDLAVRRDAQGRVVLDRRRPQTR